MPKYQYGRNLSSTLREGMFLAVIMSEIKELREPIDLSLMVHNLYESSSIKDKKWISNAINKNLRDLRQGLSPRIKKINEYISLANKTLKGLDFEHEIPKIKVSEVLLIVKNRLQTIFKVEDAQNMSNDHFHVLLGQTLQKPVSAIQNFLKLVDDEQFIDGIEELNEPYREGLRQSLAVCSIGYYSTSVFISGKTMEEAVNDYFEELFRQKKCEEFDLQEIKFSKKIGKLFGIKAINEDLYHKLSNVRIDRNEFAHPSRKNLSKTQAHLRIRTIAEIIQEMQKRLKKLESKRSRP